MLDIAFDFDEIDQIMVDSLLEGSSLADLDSLVERAYPEGGWDEYRHWIDAHGNPHDQIERFENAGIILQPHQLEFCSWARRMDTNECIAGVEIGTPELGIGGARGGGKSFTVFAQAAIDDCVRFPGCKVLYLRRIGKQAKEQLSDLKQSVLRHIEHVPTDGNIRFPNGSRILIGHFQYEKDIYNYLGMGYEIIIVEEATTLSRRAHQTMRDSNRTSMDMVPRIYNSTNPLGIGHQEYKKKFIDHERKYSNVVNRRRKFIPATVDNNHFVNEEYKGNLEGNTGAELAAYRYGIWDISAGAYFDSFNYDLHTVEPMDIPHYWPVWASMDYGFHHWNMVYLHTRYEGITYTFHEIAHRKHYPAEIAPDIHAVLARYDRNVDDLESFVVGSDAFTKRGEAEKSIVEQYAALGIKMTAALTSPGSRIAGAQKISRMLGNPDHGIEPTLLITRNCRMLIETLPSLERNPNKPEDVRKVDADSDGNGGDDAYDGARYGYFVREHKQQKPTARQWGGRR